MESLSHLPHVVVWYCLYRDHHHFPIRDTAGKTKVSSQGFLRVTMAWVLCFTKVGREAVRKNSVYTPVLTNR